MPPNTPQAPNIPLFNANQGAGGNSIFDQLRQILQQAQQDPSSQLKTEIQNLLPFLNSLLLGPGGAGIAQGSAKIRESTGSRAARSGLLSNTGGAGTTTGIGLLGQSAGQGAAAFGGAQLRQAIAQMAGQLATGELGQRRQLEAAKLAAEAEKSKSGGALDFFGKALSPFTFGLSDAIFN